LLLSPQLYERAFLIAATRDIVPTSNEKTQTEGENQKDRQGDLPMYGLIKGGGMQKTNIHKVMIVCSSFKFQRRRIQ
jgi:hypothetical protein